MLLNYAISLSINQIVHIDDDYAYNITNSLLGTPPRNTISHYLRQDVPSLEAEEVARKKIKRPSLRSLSLDAHTAIKLEKLEGVIFKFLLIMLKC